MDPQIEHSILDMLEVEVLEIPDVFILFCFVFWPSTNLTVFFIKISHLNTTKDRALLYSTRQQL